MNSKSARYPRFRLFTPNPPAFFYLGVFADGKKTSGSACIDASRLIFQSAVSFPIRFVAKKQAGPTRLFFCIPAVKPSEFTERTLSYFGITDFPITYKSTYSNFHFLISLLFSHRDMTCSIDNSNSINPQLISRSNLAHVTCIMHHYLVLFA